MAHSPNQEKASVEEDISSDQPILANHNNSTSPLSTALLRLPHSYFNALLKPSVKTFIEDKDGASWKLVWIQLLAWAILDAALGVLVNLISPPSISTPFLRFLALVTSYGLVVLVPVLFFLLMGIVYALARYFGGQGTFLEQCNASLAIQAPLGILSKLLALIPGVGRILNSVLSLYGIVLQVLVIMAVHRLSRGKAVATVFIPVVTLGVLAGGVFLLMRR
ncbi:MAG: hypothetical protein NVSMB33_17440 [Ktedonobacteraceae bacterium]